MKVRKIAVPIIVIIILIPFISIGIYEILHKKEKAIIKAAGDIRIILNGLEDYKHKKGKYPNESFNSKDTTCLKQMIATGWMWEEAISMFQDPFNRPYPYRYYLNKEKTKYVIFSLGPDKNDNGAIDYYSAINSSLRYNEKTGKGNIIVCGPLAETSK